MIDPAPWLPSAIARIEADHHRSADTHLIPRPLLGYAAAGIDLYLKDESTHPWAAQAPAGAVAVPLCAVQWLAA